MLIATAGSTPAARERARRERSVQLEVVTLQDLTAWSPRQPRPSRAIAPRRTAPVDIDQPRRQADGAAEVTRKEEALRSYGGPLCFDFKHLLYRLKKLAIH
jgi:hypothetical protein